MIVMRRARTLLGVVALLAVAAGGCSNQEAGSAGREGGRPSKRGWEGGGFPGAGGGQRPHVAVPVEVAAAERRTISSFIQTNGVLEAENEVDIVARTSGPIVELLAEEGMTVRRGQLLARLDQDEIRAQLEISRVNLNDAELAYERAKKLETEQLVSEEEYDQAKARFESAEAELEGNRIQLAYTGIEAPFDGLIVRRYVKFAETIGVNTPLFRISDFDPLLCPIQVPERELSRLSEGQRAYLTVEAWPDERFAARVERISPVVDADSGTVKVTLEVEARGKLRPGMFGSVYLETETHTDALVVPKKALALESLGDIVYVASDGTAARREVRLGFRDGDSVEILDGLTDGERVVVVGQDGLSDGTPIQVLTSAIGASGHAESAASETAAISQEGRAPERGGGSRWAQGRPDPSQMTPEQLERIKERMRARGMTEAQIEERIARARERREAAGGGGTDEP